MWITLKLFYANELLAFNMNPIKKSHWINKILHNYESVHIKANAFKVKFYLGPKIFKNSQNQFFLNPTTFMSRNFQFFSMILAKILSLPKQKKLLITFKVFNI